MAAKKKPTSTREELQRLRDKLLAQRTKLHAQIARGAKRQTRLLGMLSQIPEVAEALAANRRPHNIDAETWADLVAFVARR